jgi:preprotein translocase SecE subunit
MQDNTYMSKLINYLKVSYLELKKVDWPSRKQATHHTMLVIGISLLFAIFFSFTDKTLELGLKELVVLLK